MVALVKLYKLPESSKKGIVASFILLFIICLIILKIALSQELVDRLIIIIVLSYLLVVGLLSYLRFKRLPGNFGLPSRKCPNCSEDLSFTAPVKKDLYICPKCGRELVLKRDWRRLIVYEIIAVSAGIIILLIDRNADLVLFFIVTNIIIGYTSKKVTIFKEEHIKTSYDL